ncbi:response regulator [Globicatella sulfidifaciens]|uniref:Response regulator n=1 Tax=Globicatella sulfidifaciens TaxID=136093 RepID=A0A7X8C5R5_9LACT|nr:response regulator [Globicatella sulfidifaciens]NLJ19388.1 response regulator [Globicatella sulfidifaciens]
MIFKVINIEDDPIKHGDIMMALKKCGVTQISVESKGEDGVNKIEMAIGEGEPYNLLVLDMQFPINGQYEKKAGKIVIEQLQKKEIHIPIIVCSSIRYDIPGIVGCIHYNEANDLYSDMRDLIEKAKQNINI